MRKQSKKLRSNERIIKLLKKEQARANISVSMKLRISVVLHGIMGMSKYRSQRELKTTWPTISKWRGRWEEGYDQIEAVQDQGVRGDGKPASDNDLLKIIREILSDLNRCGSPNRFTLSQIEQIIALASEHPEDYGIEMESWTYEWLAKVAMRDKIVDSISPSYLGVILKKKEIKPHKTEYWLHPKIENWKRFSARVEMICYLILRCISGQYQGEHLFSVDEKTGIQALERLRIRNTSEGKSRRMEYEYKRHGTTCLIGAVNVQTGKMDYNSIQPTRKEEDIVNFVDQICSDICEEDKITILMDQLNVHKSEGLVRYIAKQIGYNGDLGTKRYKGILKNQKTRMAFLEQEDHRIRIVYTPKHCSWLNPIENWFGRLQRQRLRNATFSSLEVLEEKLRRYICFANDFVCKPIKWKFKGFIKNEKIAIGT